MSRFALKVLHGALRTAAVAREAILLESCTSTMIYAKELINPKHGTLIIALNQSQGRGRANRSWFAPDRALLFSIVLKPRADEMILQYAIKVNLGIAIAVAEVLDERGIQDAKIKWPNDVWVQGKKVCGVLVDLDREHIVLGVGINAGDAPKEIPTAIGLGYQDGELEFLLADVLNRLEGIIDQISMEQLLDRYTKLHLLNNVEIVVMPKRVEDKQSYWNGFCLGVDSSGFLLVRDEKGKVHQLSGEEVSVRPFLDMMNC
jgi:BirA family transcriptional regulator, biotin operon repressor / biotin---[acetyl-CoA-carboxylase] ligase